MIDLAGYRHRSVRDLAWAIASPPLLQPNHRGVFWPAPAWCRQRFDEYAPTLALLDKDPGTLDAAIADHGQRNVGSYYESLLAFWLSTTPRFRLLGRNVEACTGGRTPGEFGLLVRDVEQRRIWHIEAAVEFYLGMPATSGRARNHWLGVDATDRLGDKVRQLHRLQARLGEHPAARTRLDAPGIVVDGAMVLMKGRLYYPHRPHGGRYKPPHGAAAGHLHGTWYETRHFLETFADTPVRWRVHDRTQDLSPHLPCDRPGKLLQPGAVVESVRARPVPVIGVSHGAEVQRCFVAPPGWPAAASVS